jgi:glycosyltransferase involved in cell wall biosynthesis
MISVTILTKNSSKTLPETLKSVKEFPEVVVLDTGSTDTTLELAASCKVYSREFQGFGPTHNLASSLASHGWILSIDSDEVVSPELAKEILNLKLDPACVYMARRDNYFNGKHIKCCSGWYPDWVVRLYHRKATRFSDDAVHERILTKGLKIVKLHSPILHTPYRTTSDLITKMQIYSSLFAEQNKGRKTSSFFHAILHGGHAFLKSYFLKWGFLGGKEGLILSFHNSQIAFYKYLKLAELNKKF